uniref:Synergin gamma n=1 Tax=Scleropages formosus TaxID=113540 RepID=A0A8C9W5D9_SCLFO
MMPMQPQQQQGFPMVPVMQPNMQGIMGMNFGAQMPPGAMPMQGGMPMAMQGPAMPFMGQPQFMGIRPPGPQYAVDMQKQMAEEHQKRLEQQQRMLEEDRKRRQFEEQKQKLRLLSSVKPKTGEKSRDDALEAIKGNLDGFSRDAKMHPTPSSHPKKPGPSLEEKLFSSCDLTAEKQELELCVVLFPGKWRAMPIAQQVTLLCAATLAGVGVFPPQEHMQPMMPTWLYNDSLVPELYKKVLEFTMTPAGIDTAKLYPILMSSGLPREALGQIWASANRTTPGKLTKEELYTVLAMIGATQSGLPAMSLDILSQFPSPPVPSLPAMAMAVATVLPQHPAPMMAQPPVSIAVPTAVPAAMGVSPGTSAQPPAGFVANFPPVQVGTKPDDDDFQDFQEAPKAGTAEEAFTDFQGESGSTFPPATQNRYGRWVWQISCEGFADFKCTSADDGFTDFKTADSISPLDPPDQTKVFQPPFPPAFAKSQSIQPQLPVSLSQPRNPLNMADLDLFSSLTPSAPPVDAKLSSFPLVTPSVGAKPPGGAAEDFGDFALFGSSSSSTAVAPSSGVQDDFADFMAFGGSGEPKNEARSGEGSSGGLVEEPLLRQQQQHTSDKYDVFKQLSLEGGLGYDDAKESGGGSFSSLRSDTDDFADFQSSKFCTALGASEKSLVDKVAAFRQAKEDSSSVKSLDLPSIGGSSAGKEDSEDALSVQLDMKLSDVGGDLKHVMSDSSLDLPGLSSHQPPAADDSRFDPFGTLAVGSSTSYDWPHKEDSSVIQGKKALPGSLGPDSCSLPSSVVVHRKETSFGSSENITHTTLAKVTTFPTEAFTDFGSREQGPADEEDDFGDFASTVSEKSDSPAASAELGSDGAQSEPADEFGAFQGDKPKFGKSDFLKASSQAKVKSSEEMIQSELATFDLSVQGSHKRSHSLGEKEIGRSSLPPAPEPPFRDRSSTLSEKPALPIIRDKYKDLTGEVEESERYAYEWQRCLESALQVISKANDTLNGISSSAVCTEVIQSAQGMEYLLGVVEVYRVTRRVELGIKATAVCSEKLQQLLKDISRVWNNLMGFMSLSNLTPDESSLDFSSCILRHGIRNAKELACGVCLLNVESRSKAFNSETDNFKLLYGGHQYHASCANFWINCVEPKPPGLILPDLL